MSAGSWGVVHEPSASGPLNADVLDDTNNVMVNTAMFHAVTFQPESLQVLSQLPICSLVDDLFCQMLLCTHHKGPEALNSPITAGQTVPHPVPMTLFCTVAEGMATHGPHTVSTWSATSHMTLAGSDVRCDVLESASPGLSHTLTCANTMCFTM